MREARVEWADPTTRTFTNDQFQANLWEPVGATTDDVIVYRFECDIVICQLDGFFRPDPGKTKKNTRYFEI